MSDPCVLFDVIDSLPTITLNRPDKLNALTSAMFTTLAEHLDRDWSDTACLHLKGAGRSFCAGHDLDDLAQSESYETERFANDVIERLATLPCPVVASVQGHCFTGGLELVLAADIIVAAENAQFADTHSQWDLVPIWGMTQRLPRRIGTAKAMEMMFTAQRYSGAQALDMGLVNMCVPQAELEATAAQICRAITANSRRSNHAIKKLLRDTEGIPLAQGLAWELHRSEGHGPDFLARLSQMRS